MYEASVEQQYILYIPHDCHQDSALCTEATGCGKEVLTHWFILCLFIWFFEETEYLGLGLSGQIQEGENGK